MTPLRSDWHRVGAGFSVRFAFSGERFDAQWRPRLPTRREFERVAAAKVGEQAEFVAWWDGNIGAHHGGSRRGSSAQTVALEMESAESATGISHQQVSRWRARLKDAERRAAARAAREAHR